MTREEAIEWIKAHHDYQMDGCKDSEVMRMAIKALEQESCEDAISRKRVMLFVNEFITNPTYTIDMLKNDCFYTPSVKPVALVAKVTFDEDKLREIVTQTVEECEDCVSRQWLLEEYDRQHEGTPGGARKIIENAPFAHPERKKGKWIQDGHHIQCNQCGISICNKDREGDVLPKKFCPNCGCQMGGED